MNTIILLVVLAASAGLVTVAMNKAEELRRARGDKEWVREMYSFYNRGSQICRLTFVEGEELGTLGESRAAAGARITRVHPDGVRETFIKRGEVV